MKKYYFLCVVAVLAFITGCKPNEAESFVGNVAAPTWSAPEQPDMTSSMTAVVKVDLAKQYPDKAADFVVKEGDLLAAFGGEQCLGVASPNEDGLFFLYIDKTDGNVSLRYYSAHYTNLFEAKDAFPFRNDTHYGTVAEPFIPALEVVAQ